MGFFGKMTDVSDLPGKRVLVRYIKEAARLNDEGVEIPGKARTDRKGVKVPQYFNDALGRNKKAQSMFEAFSPSHKREYVEWITEAKSGDTRTRRIDTAIKWLAEGKSRNWKYIKK